MLSLIQGVFFQPQSSIGIVQEGPDGQQVVISNNLFRFMYMGVLSFDKHQPNKFDGQLWDNFGESAISGTKPDDTRFSFTKKYYRRPDTIKYEFVKNGNLWVGHWRGEAVGEGYTNCSLTPINIEFLNLVPTKSLFDSLTAPKPPEAA